MLVSFYHAITACMMQSATEVHKRSFRMIFMRGTHAKKGGLRFASPLADPSIIV